MFTASLTNCDREPIHMPGKIQDYGFLIILNSDYKMVGCSENISSFLSVSARSLLDQPASLLETYFQHQHGSGFMETVLNLVNSRSYPEAGSPFYVEMKGVPYNLLISRSAATYILEFEPESADRNSDVEHMMGAALSQMLAEPDLQQLLGNSAKRIKNIIGYDRIMIYKFHADGHGEVVAEARNHSLEPWLGLHYPASDIPRQARELYKINLTRQIADVNREPSSMITVEKDLLAPDFTHVALRAVSPIHIQYLKNMEVASSFSISLLYHGELWGLVACHNYTPRFINFKAREAARLIGQVLSSAISFRQLQEDQHTNDRLKATVDSLSLNLLHNEDIHRALFGHEVKLLDAVEATGVILSLDAKLAVAGSVPGTAFIKELIGWLQENMQSNLYETNHLSLLWPAALPFKNYASGILACVLSRELKEYIIWFRPEVSSTVTWAGNPDKSIKTDDHGLGTISPRTSFADWSETIRNSAAPWKTEDIKSARQIREKVVFAIGRKANELRVLNSKLKEAYEELDAFSYTLSHDLNTPLTSVKSYSQLLLRNASLDATGQQMAQRILSSAAKMQLMIRDIMAIPL